MLRKGYVSSEEWHDTSEGKIVDYFFTSNPKSARFWETIDEAEAACTIFNNTKIMIPSAEGGKHLCSDFKAEERTPNEFIVFCEAPFIPIQSSDILER